jgi:hypothetical protein
MTKLWSRERSEELWLELFDHNRQQTIDSYRGRDLEDIAIAARSLGSKKLRGAERTLLGNGKCQEVR